MDSERKKINENFNFSNTISCKNGEEEDAILPNKWTDANHYVGGEKRNLVPNRMT